MLNFHDLQFTRIKNFEDWVEFETGGNLTKCEELATHGDENLTLEKGTAVYSKFSKDIWAEINQAVSNLNLYEHKGKNLLEYLNSYKIGQDVCTKEEFESYLVWIAERLVAERLLDQLLKCKEKKYTSPYYIKDMNHMKEILDCVFNFRNKGI